ncbi:MAG: hypothetical protein IT178_01100 [Acidobacteria bacterium]|nr:hypothetical protein [Acidobacteriota bacterium]
MTERKAFLLRVDPAVLEAVQRWANDDLRSLNAQIEFLLRRALKEHGRPVREAAPASPPPRRR